MKHLFVRVTALVLVFCLCAAVFAVGAGAEESLPYEPGPIDLDVTIMQKADHTYKVTYTARLEMIEFLAKAATLHRSDERMRDLRFICTLNDPLVNQVTDIGKNDFLFDSVEWNGHDVFVYVDSAVTNKGIEISYKISDAVLDAWTYADDVTAITEALMQPMTITATEYVSAQVFNKVGIHFSTTAVVELQGEGINALLGRYSVVGAVGRTVSDPVFIKGSAALVDGCNNGDYCPLRDFVDVSVNAWYHNGVHFAIENGLMVGTGKGRFEPNVPVTRGMMVTILYRMENTPAVKNVQVYEDVPLDQWYSKAVEWADSVNVVNGYGDSKFGPNDPVTREQMTAILYRYAQYKGVDVSVGENTNILSYHDAFDISSYAIPAMQWACGVGLLKGADGYLMPRGNTTRAQLATTLQRYYANFV